MVPLDKLAQITQRFDYVEARLNAGGSPADIAALSREYSDLGPVIAEINAYRQALDDLAEAELMLADPEMKALAEEELPQASKSCAISKVPPVWLIIPLPLAKMPILK
jgi:peptide chain release factor 1